MASLWFGAGNNWNPLLWRRQVLYKIPNQSKPSTHESSQQRDADVWPGMCTLFDTTVENKRKKKKDNATSEKYKCVFSTFSCQTDELMPVRFDEEFLIWVAAEQPLKDTTFLSNKILDLCGKLPIFWLQPVYPKGCLLLFSKLFLGGFPLLYKHTSSLKLSLFWVSRFI